MATYYLSSVNGNDATADGTKSLPYATFGAIPFTNGDLILIDSNHNTPENLIGPAITAGAPIQLVSIDWNSGTGNADENYLSGAWFNKSGGFVCRGGIYTYGVRIKQTSGSYWCEFGKDVDSDIRIIGGDISPGASTNLRIVGPSGTTFYTNRIIFEGTSINLSTGTAIEIEWGAHCHMIGCSLSSDPGTDGLLRIYEGTLYVDGMNLSNMTSGALLDLSKNAKLQVRNTPIPTGVSLIATGGISASYLVGGELLYISPEGSLDYVSAEGQVGTSKTVYRNGGATLSNGSNISFMFVTEARTVTGVKSLYVSVDKRILDISTSKTLRVYFAQEGGTPLTDQELWVDVRYRKPSNGLGTQLVTRPAAPHLPATTYPVDNVSTWTGLTNSTQQYVDITIPADVAGEAHTEIVVHVAKPSTTVYVDPSVEIV